MVTCFCIIEADSLILACFQIQLTPQQLQSLQLQLQSKIAGQQIVVQAQQDPNVQFSQAQVS